MTIYTNADGNTINYDNIYHRHDYKRHPVKVKAMYRFRDMFSSHILFALYQSCTVAVIMTLS